MGIGSFTDDDEASSAETKVTYYQFENPQHEDSKDFDDPETAKRHFDAARHVQQRLKADRHNLVGEFLVGVQQLDEDDDPSHLKSLVDKLME